MWYLWKMWIWKWEFCEKCILKMWISWMMWFWTCGFLDQIWIFAPVCFPMNYIVYGFKIGNNLWLWEINLKASKVTKPKLVTMETEKNVFMILHMFCWCCDVMAFLCFLPKFPTASSCFFTRSGMNFFAQKMNFTVFYLVRKWIYPKKQWNFQKTGKFIFWKMNFTVFSGKFIFWLNKNG